MEKVFCGSILSLCFFFALVAPCYGDYNWDWMDCHNGTYYSNWYNNTFVCDCNAGWKGWDCSLCANKGVCVPSQICDDGFFIEEYKAFSCLPQGTPLTGFGSLTSQWGFPSATNASENWGIISAFVHSNGAPFLFNCSFSDCTKSIDVTTGVMVLSCEQTSCFCSQWCSSFLLNIIKGMKGSASFTCYEQYSNCSLDQAELPVQISVLCQAAGCQTGPYIPPPPTTYNPWQLVIIIGGSLLCALFLFGAVGLSCYLLKKRKIEKYRLFVASDFSVNLSFTNLSCSIKVGRKERIVLQNATGACLPGQVTAILGPSGAGKTTFLDILAGRKNIGKIEGEILINGKPRTKGYRRIAGYVLQDDKMLGTYTVREHLMFIANLRLPAGMPSDEKKHRVNEVMRELGISHIADVKIGTEMTRGISGGEKRRLSIASELVTDPRVLLLDEPTSGLDSYTAYMLMKTLNGLARNKNRTIVTTIHQPRSNIYQLFDNVMLLSEGEVIYYGPANEAIDHFAALSYECPRNYNPADFLVDMVTMNPGNARNLAQFYRDSNRAVAMGNIISSIQIEDVTTSQKYDEDEYATAWHEQCWELCKRTLINNLRNPYLLRTQYAVTAIIGVVIGGIFWKLQLNIEGVQDRAGCLFFMIALLSFGSMSAIDIFFQERPVFVRERANGMYGTSAYFVAKALCDIVPMRVIPPIILGSICYYMIGLHPGYTHFLIFLFALVLTNLVSASLCLALGASSPSLSMANLLAIVLLLFYLLFGGFLVNKTSMPWFIGWLQWTSFLNFAFELLLCNELTGLTIMFEPKGFNITVPLDGSVFLEQFDMEQSRQYLDFGLLGGFTLIYLIGAYCVLRWAIKENR